MLFSILLYSLSFSYLNQLLCPIANYETRDYIISSFHAFTTVGLSTLFLLNIITDVKYIYYCPITIGYAIFDTINLIHHEANKYNLFIILHHSIIVIGNIWLILYKDPYVLKILSINYLAEVSTPFLNLSMYLYKNKLTELSLYNLNIFNITSNLLIITYFLFRVVLLTYLVWETAFYNNLYYIQVGLALLNYFWFYKILKMEKLV
jgi:hypothetical protein